MSLFVVDSVLARSERSRLQYPRRGVKMRLYDACRCNGGRMSEMVRWDGVVVS